MQTISFPAYPDILLWGSRGMLAILLGAMPWATLSQAASPPSQVAGMMHMVTMAVFMISRRYRSRGYNSWKMLILGAGTTANEIIEAVRTEPCPHLGC